MNLIPTWPIAVGALTVGLALGAYADHTVMSSKVSKLETTLAQVQTISAQNEARQQLAARVKEQDRVVEAGRIEQEKTNAIIQNHAAVDAAVNSERMRIRTNRKPAPESGVSAPAATCAGSTGAELSRPDATFLVGFAGRAEDQRAALAACYQAYDSLK